MDAEEWFHVPGNPMYADAARWGDLPPSFPRALHKTLDFLDGAGIRATFFVLGWLARRYPGEVKRLAASGHEIACHGRDHQLVFLQSPEAFKGEVGDAKGAIEDLTGLAVRGFRAPRWSMPRDSWPYDVLRDLGFGYSSSTLCIPGLGGGIPRSQKIAGVWEIPALSSGRGPFAWPAGGTVALRVAPMGRLLAARNRAVGRGCPAVYWFHPWELLPDAPRVSGGALFRWARYAALERLPQRLRALVPAGDRTLATALRLLDDLPENRDTKC